MQVLIRHENETEGRHFEACEPREVEELVAFLKRSGGVLHEGEWYTDLSYQFVLTNTAAFAEIILA